MQNEYTALTVDRKDHRLPAEAGRDTPLNLRQVTPSRGQHHAVPVVMLHGATFGSAMFDIDVPGYSLQGFLAEQGWTNFALDVRGYGRSVPSPVLDAPAKANPPYARLGDAVDDLAAGVDFVLRQSQCRRAHVVGFSWGTVVANHFAAKHPELVDRLVLYAPLFSEVNDSWIDRIADPTDRSKVNPQLGAYRWISERDIRTRWDSDIPKGAAAADYREEKVLNAIITALVKSDPAAGNGAPPSFRAPTGALVDLFEIFNARPLYDPAAIAAATLIIRGRDDTTSTQSDALRLLAALGTANKRYIEIAPGSHFLCAEHNAKELFGEIDLFLRG
jgi:pimeloyl-ACP methyl ester carboxylesterase